MNFKQKTHRKKVWIVAVILIVIIIGLLFTYLALAKDGALPILNQSSTQDDTNDKGNDPLPNTTNGLDKTSAPNSDRPAQTETDQASGKRIVPVVASAEVDGNTIYVRGGMNTPESEGTCLVELTGPANEKVQKETTLLPNASSSDCKTVIIPTKELSPGEWKLVLNFSSSSAKGASSATTFVIK